MPDCLGGPVTHVTQYQTHVYKYYLYRYRLHFFTSIIHVYMHCTVCKQWISQSAWGSVCFQTRQFFSAIPNLLCAIHQDPRIWTIHIQIKSGLTKLENERSINVLSLKGTSLQTTSKDQNSSLFHNQLTSISRTRSYFPCQVSINYVCLNMQRLKQKLYY